MKLSVTLVVDLQIFDTTTGVEREPVTDAEREALVVAVGTRLAKIRTGLQMADFSHMMSINEVTVTGAVIVGKEEP